MARFELSFRERPLGGAVVPGRLSRGYSGDLKRADSITFVTHGYNVNEANSRSRLTNLAKHLPAASRERGAVVVVLWPGDSWMKGLAYPFKGQNADDTAFLLARYIVDHGLENRSLNFVSHSLGGRVVMQCIKHLRPRPINQVCLMAAAMDDFSLSVAEQFRDDIPRIKRVAVLASRKDKVLSRAYPLGDLTHFFQDWSNEPGLALGLHGPRPREIEGVDHFQIDSLKPNPNANHGHFVLDLMASDKVRKKQLAAARYANAVIAGRPNPEYTLE